MSKVINSFSICENCKKEEAVIFHDHGEFCVYCWDEHTHPDIEDLIKQACQQNQQVAGYIGTNYTN